MSVRGSFEMALSDLKVSIVNMGKEVEQALQTALLAFLENDEALMDQVIKADTKINQLEMAINDKVTLMIAKQQPVASDLRKAIVALKISSDLERVGDLTVDIAKVSKRLSNVSKEDKKHLLLIAEIAKEMLTVSIQAYIDKDILQAQKIAQEDDKVDKLYGEFIKALFQSQTHKAEEVINLAFIGRYIERIADYATNLAEWVVYEVNGKHFDLN